MPVYRSSRKGQWRVVIWSGGKPHEKLVRGSKAEANAFEASERLRLRAEDCPEARAGMTFADFCAHRYREHAERQLGRRTWHESRRYQIETLCSALGNAKLATLSTATVEAFKAARVRAGMRPSTVNSELRALSAVLSWARASGQPVSRPAIKPLRESGPSRARAFGADELARLFAACSATARWLTPLVTFAVNTGMRCGEIIAAEWQWVDVDARLVRVPVTREWRPKSGRAREVPLSDAALASLGPVLPSGPLFCSRYGRHRLQWPVKHWQRAVKLAELSGGAHQLRHTFSSHFLANGGSMFDLARILGHTTQHTTERYSHMLPDHMANLRNVVNLAPPLETVITDHGHGAEKSETA
jgi:integrase